MKKRKRLKLKGIIKDLHLDVHEATSILHKRTDLGVFHGQEINTLQLGALIDYAKNRTNVDKKKPKRHKSKKLLQNTNTIQNVKFYKSIKCVIKEQLLQADNLEFFDCYYKIWVIDSDKAKRRDISPFVIRDVNSRACFNVLNKYFANRLPCDIFIQYSNERVMDVNKSPILSTYIKILKENGAVEIRWGFIFQNP